MCNSDIYRKRLRETTRNIGQDNRGPADISAVQIPEYEFRASAATRSFGNNNYCYGTLFVK
jgi:hypothetical protein